ncbi:MAG TPA: alkaline phosphatase family protein [Polyangiaceae bacterium]|nr:alkaline phosphatase family protein [Polyangiaceae bacterium]
MHTLRRTSLGLAAASILGMAWGCSSDSRSASEVAADVGQASASLTVTPSTSSKRGSSQSGKNDRNTRTPIKHVMVIIGENRTFDHVFGTYKPKNGQKISNILSKGIVNEDGSPGPHFADAVQRSATDSQPARFEVSPNHKTPYSVLPPVLAGGAKTPYVATLADAQAAEGAALPADYVPLLLTGATGLDAGTPDTRLSQNPLTVPPGPFQLTPGVAYDDYAASPVHRFYQMWQQLDCSVANATHDNPSGCKADLFPWVEVTIGAGNNGAAQPAGFDDTSTKEGSTAMGFYNVLKGDAPYFKSLADTYTINDNMHQSIQGGTGANHIALGTGDADWFSDGSGHPAVPPTLNTENPDPQAGTNNWYTQDGYSGGSYSNCSDTTQPGVGSVASYLSALHVNRNCEKGHYYLLNNYNPGYLGDGTVDTEPFTIPPSSTRTIGDELLAHDISWRYYGENWNAYVADPDGYQPGAEYCNICNPFQYATSIMTNDSVRTTHLKDTTDLATDIANGWLPAFSIVKPSGLLDGHPASSKLDLFEGFTKKIVDAIKANPQLFKDTAIFITFDEGGGYWDSGYVQPLDFFGDGTRIPLITVSPYSTGGYVSHQYADHVSILKFVERNWRLSPITGRSRDNLPNPLATRDLPWVPRNGPSIDDLMDEFDFGRRGADQDWPANKEWSRD